MKVKRIVEINADSLYLGWSGLEITDVNGDEVKVSLSREQIATLAERFTDKVNRDRKEQLKKLREQLEELEDADADCS